VKFVWVGQAGVTNYWHEIAIDSLFAFVTVDSALTDTTKTVNGLLNNQTYFWRVKAKNGGGWGPFSVVRRFTVVVTSVDQGRGLPDEFSLGQNYPNPFNPTTVIEFALPKEGYVKLDVYNTLGERVATLAEGFRPAGYYREEFNAMKVPSGLYFYRLNVSSLEKTFVKKMLLLK
jgi:hypothetical protein